MALRVFFNTVILLGSLQGFIIGTLLVFTKVNRLSNRILAALILLIGLAGFNLYGNYINWFNSGLLRFITQLVPMIIPMAFGPLIYFYVQSTLDPDFRITKKQRLHFYPVLIDFIPSLTILIYGIGLITKLVKNNPAPWGIFIDDYNVYADIPRWMSVTFYVWLSGKYLLDYKFKRDGVLNGQAFKFKWLSQFIKVFTVFQCIWLAYLVPYVIPRYTGWMLDTFDWYPIYIPLSVIIYWLGLKGYLMAHQQSSDSKKTISNNPSLPTDLVEQVSTALTKIMEENKTYLSPNLTLAMVAEQTGINQRTISTVLNQHLHKTFIEFVNEYRVAEFKEKVGQSDKNNLTIAGIALECGFSSQATFQRVFKNNTGLTPTEFISAKAQTPEMSLKT